MEGDRNGIERVKFLGGGYRVVRRVRVVGFMCCFRSWGVRLGRLWRTDFRFVFGFFVFEGVGLSMGMWIFWV